MGYNWTIQNETDASFRPMILDRPLILDRTRPFTCPNCNGYGNEAKMHYQLVPTAMVCWSCGGSGIVWG